MQGEPFGMAVAELISGGCVTFVPNSGGQVEIVGNDERLIYSSREDAVNKILRALREPDYQASLRSHVASRRNLFGAKRFVEPDSASGRRLSPRAARDVRGPG